MKKKISSEVSEYMSKIGKKGGEKSKRVLETKESKRLNKIKKEKNKNG